MSKSHTVYSYSDGIGTVVLQHNPTDEVFTWAADYEGETVEMGAILGNGNAPVAITAYWEMRKRWCA